MKTVALLSRPTPTSARLVAELYALFGVAWIWISHRASGSNPAPATPAGGLLHDHLALLNPLGFVAVSALALHLLLRAANRRYEAAHRAELSAASRYRALLDTSLDAIHVLDSEGRLIEANRAFYLSLGHDPGRPPELMVADWDARWTPKELRAKIAALMDRSEVFETIHRRRDGGSFEAEVSATGIEFEGRRLLVCVARDLTGRRQLQRAQHDQLRRGVEDPLRTGQGWRGAPGGQGSSQSPAEIVGLLLLRDAVVNRPRIAAVGILSGGGG